MDEILGAMLEFLLARLNRIPGDACARDDLDWLNKNAAPETTPAMRYRVMYDIAARHGWLNDPRFLAHWQLERTQPHRSSPASSLPTAAPGGIGDLAVEWVLDSITPEPTASLRPGLSADPGTMPTVVTTYSVRIG
jgi:hypothetical protein